MCIYIYIERERDRYTYMYIRVYIYTLRAVAGAGRHGPQAPVQAPADGAQARGACNGAYYC